MKSDLRNLGTAEEAFFYDSAKYTTSLAQMNNFQLSAGVTLASISTVVAGWSASFHRAYAPSRLCVLFSGNSPPLTPAMIEGRITCQ